MLNIHTLLDQFKPMADHPHRFPSPYTASRAAVERAKAEAAKERAEADAEAQAGELERHAAIQVLTEMIDTYGFDTVRRWLRNIAAGMGRDL